MNKIKQNKITFTLILSAITITFSSLAILSLPVLFNYKSKLVKIENNFYKNFKLYLNSSGSISYKPFPKPHLLVENASLSLHESDKSPLIKTTNLKVFISLRDLYLRSFRNFISTEISNTNLYIQLLDFKKIRKHFYESVNKPIFFKDCKFFIKNKKDKVIIISPVKKINYKINNKTKIKNFFVQGEVFGFNFKSDWKRNYDQPNKSLHLINLINPSIEIKNLYEFKSAKEFKGFTEIEYSQDKLKYELNFNNNELKITSPLNKNINFNTEAKILFDPFYFNGSLKIKNKKVENIIDNLILKILLYDEKFLGNINGNLKIEFIDLNNKLIKNGEIDLVINQKTVILKKANFSLDKIGNINTTISFSEHQGDIKFFSKNHLVIENHIEFAKAFQVGSKKVKNIKDIYFNLEKSIGSSDFIISDIKINDIKNNNKESNEIYLVKNIQNLRSFVREVID